MTSPDTSFWDQRYAAGRMPWDQPAVPRAFLEFLARCTSPGRALVPGCGSGYELNALHHRGWDVLGVDYSPQAVTRAKTILGPLAHRVRCEDFFEGACEAGSFDLIYERTFLCALPHERWTAYGRRMRELLRPGGLLCGFFFFGPEDEPPPFPLAEDQLRHLLGPDFERIEDTAVDDSLPLYAGKERWQVWRRA